ncbi:hypothetical protein PHLGIDRAFT_19348 [Phlebiopsis gigantea 11061_1 CR5-6]|uniref:Glyoxal oxidase n=1 Tax=Phlebiopsis gigantea (strain 11061_1 CR5-6) TaxID=745531 RepID=A0A0C3PKJ7_PHLG1|nr:hypothetical protein PHLGIDRAFT_19348 [Phlebiopsis gigantea 11061_1 CR5-6]
MYSLLALGLGATAALAQSSTGGEGHAGGSFEDAGNTQVSAMMMFLGNEETVYILDKVEGNAVKFGNYPAVGAVYDIASRTATPIGVTSNPFCASGTHMPNGSYIAFGGNNGVGPGGNDGDVAGGSFDSTYGDEAGQTGVRVMNPLTCSGSSAATDAACQWYDNPNVTHLMAKRWYSTAEALGDGTVAVIGGFTNGGYINRNWPNDNDPVYQGGASSPTYEFWPSTGAQPPVMQFLVDAGGLNSYPLTYLLASGNMVLQANVSTILWDPATGTETSLPPMPDNIVRVYPASGANAMLPMTPTNNYSQTVLFCGGSDMPNDAWGNYSWPWINTWDYPASNKCHRLEAEPQDGSAPQYVEDDNMLEGRTMGQFIILPTGKMLVINGGLNGTAGYSQRTLLTPDFGSMPYGESLASGPVGQPKIYDPNAPAGQRWSQDGLGTSNLPRLYHSSALLLPSGAVFVAGSNPNVDVNTTTVFPTTYQAEMFFPPYFSAPVRPSPTGVPKNISYGGDAFDITIPASSYSGSANDAADNSTVVIIRPGFTTHAMNMGQRYLQLNNTYTVNQDGSITLHVAQMPPNPNLFQPGPALLFVNVNDIPSNGTMVIVGNGEIGTQPTAPAAQLPASIRLNSAQGSGEGSNSSSNSSTGGSSSNDTSGAMSAVSVHGSFLGVAVAAAAVLFSIL